MKKPIIDIHSDRVLVLQTVCSIEYLRYHKAWQEIKYGVSEHARPQIPAKPLAENLRKSADNSNS